MTLEEVKEVLNVIVVFGIFFFLILGGLFLWTISIATKVDSLKYKVDHISDYQVKSLKDEIRELKREVRK